MTVVALKGYENLVWGTDVPTFTRNDIINLPDDVISVKIKVRHRQAAMAFLKFADRFESWILFKVDDRHIKLGIKRGANGR